MSRRRQLTCTRKRGHIKRAEQELNQIHIKFEKSILCKNITKVDRIILRMEDVLCDCIDLSYLLVGG